MLLIKVQTAITIVYHWNTTFSELSPKHSHLKKKCGKVHGKKLLSMLHVQIRVLKHLNSGYKRVAVRLRNTLKWSVHATCKMPRLSEENRNQAIGRLEAGETQSSVARHFNVRQSTICRLWQRYNLHHSTRDRPRSGRPRATTPAQDRFIRVLHLRNRTVSAEYTAHNIPGLRRISAQTVRNRLRQHGIRPMRPYTAPVLRRQHRRARLRWCRNVRPWTLVQWRRIWFSDESRFLLYRHDGRMRVYRRRNERYAQHCIQGVDRYGGGSVMMWAAISVDGRTDLVHVQGNLTAVRYRDEILQRHLIPAIDVRRQMFQHDNARPHTARVTVDYLAQNNVPVLPWPSKSPDLNPIEHLWDLLDRRVRRRQPQPQTLEQLRNALQDEWGRIPQQQIRRLIQSMPRRCQAVLDAHGGNTRYWMYEVVVTDHDATKNIRYTFWLVWCCIWLCVNLCARPCTIGYLILLGKKCK